MLINISTEYRGDHRDFQDIEDLEIYLFENSIEETDQGSELIIDEVKRYILSGKPYIVLPINSYDDLTIHFDYEG